MTLRSAARAAPLVDDRGPRQLHLIVIRPDAARCDLLLVKALGLNSHVPSVEVDEHDVVVGRVDQDPVLTTQVALQSLSLLRRGSKEPLEYR